MSHREIEIQDLHFSYPDGHVAIQHISFSIQHGESVGIIGANGAGKSTLLTLLMGINLPKSGQIFVDDIQLTKKAIPAIRKKLGMVFQNPDDQLFMTSVYDDVAFGPRNEKLEEQEVDRRVIQALEIVGISHLKDRSPFKLSGGEKRSAAIASVLSMNPDVLIMDEPTSALDPKSRRRLIVLLNNMNHTKLITSHDLDLVLETCERTLVIKEGKIAADGPTFEILSNEELLDSCGLEIPLSLQNCPICGSSKMDLKKQLNFLTSND